MTRVDDDTFYEPYRHFDPFVERDWPEDPNTGAPDDC